MALTAGKSIRACCLDCCLGSAGEVRHCPAESCSLWPWRFGQRPETRGLARRSDGLTATGAVQSHCRDCHETRRDCHTPDCDLYHIRHRRRICVKNASPAAFGDAGASVRLPIAIRGAGEGYESR